MSSRAARRVGGVPSYVRGASRSGKRLAVVIGLGESLMVGQASNSSGMPSTYPPASGVYKFTDSGVYTAIIEPSDDPGARPVWTAIADPSGQFGHAYASPVCWRLWKGLGGPSSAYDVLYVPCGRSGTTSWDWRVGGKLLSDAIAKGRAALSLPDAELAAVLLDQGVNDCTGASDPDGLTWSQRWAPALTRALGAWHARPGVKVYGRRLPLTVTSGYDATKWGNLRTEELGFASSSRIIVDGYDGGFVGGGPHYAAPGNERMSRRKYEAIRANPPPLVFPTLTGRRGWRTWPSGTTVFGTTTTEGVFGTSGGGAVLILARWDAIAGSVQRWISRVNGNSGFDYRVNGATIQAIVGNGTTTATAPTRTIVSGDLNKLHLSCVAWNGSAVFHYLDNAQIGASSPLAGFAPATGKSLCVMSTDGGASANTSITLLDWALRDSFLSLADFQTICAQTKAAGYLTPGAISMGGLYQFPLESVAPDYVRDSVGGADCDFLQGSESNVVHETIDLATAQWGW